MRCSCPPARDSLVFWVPKDGSATAQAAAASIGDEKDKYDFDGETYSYKDDATGKRFKWDLEKKEWKEVTNIKVNLIFAIGRKEADMIHSKIHHSRVVIFDM